MKFLAWIGGAVILAPFVLGMALLGMMWRSWWLYPAWAWFLVPLGVPQVSFWHFMAIVLLIGMLTQVADNHKDERKTEWSLMAINFLWPMVVWALLRWLR